MRKEIGQAPSPFAATMGRARALNPSNGDRRQRKRTMRSIILLALGVPIPIILLLAFCTQHL
jgi:hypothetical protein